MARSPIFVRAISLGLGFFVIFLPGKLWLHQADTSEHTEEASALERSPGTTRRVARHSKHATPSMSKFSTTSATRAYDCRPSDSGNRRSRAAGHLAGEAITSPGSTPPPVERFRRERSRLKVAARLTIARRRRPRPEDSASGPGFLSAFPLPPFRLQARAGPREIGSECSVSNERGNADDERPYPELTDDVHLRRRNDGDYGNDEHGDDAKLACLRSPTAVFYPGRWCRR